MRLSALGVALVFSVLLVPRTVVAQPASGAATSVPRVMQFTGTFRPANGQPPAPVEIVTFAIYGDETGGTALWQETQNVTIAGGGEYTIVLGSTSPEGLPLDVFASGQAHWLGVHVERAGESEQPRIRIMSVPYALRSADADTLGGKPASAYVLAEPATSTSTAASGKPASTKSATTPGATTQSATTGWIPVATDSVGGLGNSVMFQSASNFIGVGTMTPNDAVHSVVNDGAGNFTGYAVQNLNPGALAYSGMLFYDHTGALTQFQGYNNVTHEYRINNIARVSPGGAFNGSINFMIGGTSRFLVTSGGNVGIGTTGPGALLDVSNALISSAFANVATTSYTGTNATGSRFVGRHARGTGGAPTALLNGDNLVGFIGQGYGATGFSSGRAGMFVQAAENWTDLAQGTNLTFTTTPTGTTTQLEQMRIDQAGNVGIGTSVPRNALEVVRTGAANITSTSFGGETGLGLQFARGTAAAPSAVQTGDTLGFVFLNGYGATQFGNGGAVVGAVAAENWTDTAQGGAIGLGTTALGSTSPTIHLAVLPTGNVGLDTPQDVHGFLTATDKLQVFGDVRVGTTGTNGCVKNFAGTGLIGTCSSDRRLKKNITPFGSVLEQVIALQPVHFNWRVDEFPDRHFGDSRAYGLIAQDVEEALPELVVTGDDGYKQVDYSKLPLLTIQAVKELKSENDALKQRVADLEKMMKELLATSGGR